MGERLCSFANYRLLTMGFAKSWLSHGLHNALNMHNNL